MQRSPLWGKGKSQYMYRTTPSGSEGEGLIQEDACLVVLVDKDAQLLGLLVLLRGQRIAYLGRQLPAVYVNPSGHVQEMSSSMRSKPADCARASLQ